MSGINYGNSFIKRTKWATSEGVFFAPKINKWIVRKRHGKFNVFTTVAKFNTKDEADILYQTLTK